MKGNLRVVVETATKAHNWKDESLPSIPSLASFFRVDRSPCSIRLRAHSGSLLNFDCARRVWTASGGSIVIPDREQTPQLTLYLGLALPDLPKLSGRKNVYATIMPKIECEVAELARSLTDLESAEQLDDRESGGHRCVARQVG